MSGFLADLIEKCMERAGVVMSVLVLAATVAIGSAWFNLRLEPETPEYVKLTSIASLERQKLEARFPALDQMLTLRLASADPQAVKAVRTDALAVLRSRADVFREVVSPGFGPYYDTYAFLHQDLALMQRRIAYVQDLRPLLDAVSRSRTLGSMAALTDSVAAAAGEGRNPQVFVEVYRAVARTVEAALNARSDPVNWTAIAGLEGPPDQRMALILAWPHPEKLDEAVTVLEQLRDQKSSAGVRLNVVSPPVQESVDADPVIDSVRVLAAAAIAFIMIMLVLLVLSRNPAYVAVVLLTWIASLVLWAGMMSLLPAFAWPDVPPLVIASGFSLALLAYAANAVMLAYKVKATRGLDVIDVIGRNASRWLMIPIVFLVSFLGCVVYVGADLVQIVSAMVLLNVITALVAILLLPVLWQFARDHRMEHRMSPPDRGGAGLLVMVLVGLISLASQLVLLPMGFKDATPAVAPPPSLSLLASSEPDAARMVTALRAMPEVKGARWLAGFLPEDGAGKQALLASLDVTLPEPDIPEPGAETPEKRLADAKRLEAALTAVSLAGGADDAMKSAALAARRSLTAVLETGSQESLPQIERDLFSGLVGLSARLRQLAALQMPGTDKLDPAVTSMFQASDGTYRIEVEPADGVSANGLAFTLVNRGLLPVSRAVELQDQRFQFHRAVFVFLGIGTLAGFLLLVLARTDHMRAILTGLATLISIVATVILMLITKSGVNQTTIVLGLAVLGCMWGQAAMSPMSELFRLRRSGGRKPVDFVHWLLPLSAGAVALSFWLVGEERRAVQALAIAAILLQTACLQAAVALNRT